VVKKSKTSSKAADEDLHAVTITLVNGLGGCGFGETIHGKNIMGPLADYTGENPHGGEEGVV